MSANPRLLSLVLACLLAIPTPAIAFDDNQRLDLVAEAAPDECFDPDAASFISIGEDGNCEDPGTPKTNEAYIWSLTSTGDEIWFGTGANVNCLVGGIYLGSSTPNVVEGNYACEYGSSDLPAGIYFPDGYSLPDGLGDWRPDKPKKPNK